VRSEEGRQIAASIEPALLVSMKKGSVSSSGR
jgi:hypothetical protein